MNRLTIDERNALLSIPLQDVMTANGFSPHHKVKDVYYYMCPHPAHDDKNASFCVQACEASGRDNKDAQQAFFSCHGCHKLSGTGAIELQAQLMGVDAHGSGFWKVVTKLSRTFGIPVSGVTNEHEHFVIVDPVDEFAYKETEWTDFHLKALGCSVSDQFSHSSGSDDEEATGCSVFSWSMAGEPEYRHPVPTNANELGNDIRKRFGMFPVSEFVTPKRSGSDGKPVSYRLRATDTYPIFCIRTDDENGSWRIKKYEPYNTPDKKGRSYKWTWWYQGGSQQRDYRGMLYGDSDVMDVLYNNDVVPMDTSIRHDHPVVDVTRYTDDGQLVTEHRFRRVVICSGPRDAMQVYYHSDCHVVYPHSETSMIDRRLIMRLLSVSEHVYVLFDADKTGVKAARELCLEFLTLRNIELPADLSAMTTWRSGKQCKDASEYFEFYGSVLKKRGVYGGIDAHFERMLCRSIPCQFWKRTRVQSNSEKPLGKCHYNYSLDNDPMMRFLYYCGMCKVEKNGVIRFCIVRNNIVEFIHEKKVVMMARKLMKDWLSDHPRFYDPDMSTRITTSKQMLSYDALLDLPTVELDFRHWDSSGSYVHFFFNDHAVKVDVDGLHVRDYADLEFHVNSEAILPHSFVLTPQEWSVEINAEVEEMERSHRERLDMIQSSDLSAVSSENAAWQESRVLWEYLLKLDVPMNSQCDAFQYLYDTCRIYYSEEEASRRAGRPKARWLSREHQQAQDKHFISKVAAIGYMLSRHRTTAMSRIAYLTDYDVKNEMKPTGRTGKSILGNLMKCVSKCCAIPGKNFKVSAEMAARNFKSYDYLRDGYININDLSSLADVEMFYNWAEGELVKKNLHHDEEDIPKDFAAKIMVSSNKLFDMSVVSTRGRLWPMFFSGYYHISDVNGTEESSPYKKFGYTLGEEDPKEQFDRMVNFFLRCVQFYLCVRDYVEPPVSDSARRRQLFARSEIRDKRFIEWADKIFAGDLFYGVPLPKSDLVVSWYQFIGKNVDSESVLQYMKGSTFDNMLKAYCTEMKISVNPDVVFAQPSLRGGKPKVKAWVYEFGPDGRLTGKRVYRAQQTCYYFYQHGDIPESLSSVMLHQDEHADPACEGYISD